MYYPIMQRSKRRNLLCAAISVALGIFAFVQCQVETKEMMEPVMDYCVNGAEAVRAATKGKGPLQLAGGTNASTVRLLLSDERPAGVAFGGMARRLLMPLIHQAQAQGTS